MSLKEEVQDMKEGLEIEIRGLELIGAYGRETSMQDWQDGKDFKIIGGPYCSIRDVPGMIEEGFGVLEFSTLDGRHYYTKIISQMLEYLIYGE